MEKVTLKGQPIQILGSLPEVGSPCPEMKGVDIDLKERKVEEFQGKKKVICFVPSLDTPICSLSAQRFQGKLAGRPDACLIYCSMDLPFALQKGYGKESGMLALSLFRDPKIAEMWGSLIGDGVFAGLCARSVFVVDSGGKVLYRQLVPELTQEPDYEKALALVEQQL